MLNNILVGCAVFAGISIFTRIPFLGWFGWVLALGCWIWLASRIVSMGKDSLINSPNPRIPAMGYSALIGLTSGFVGALVSLIINVGVMSAATHAGDAGVLVGANAGVGALRDFIGLFTRSAFGAIICGLAGLAFGGKISPSNIM